MEGNFVLRFLLVTVDEQKITSGASTGKIIPLLRGATCGSVSSVGQVVSVHSFSAGNVVIGRNYKVSARRPKGTSPNHFPNHGFGRQLTAELLDG